MGRKTYEDLFFFSFMRLCYKSPSIAAVFLIAAAKNITLTVK